MSNLTIIPCVTTYATTTRRDWESELCECIPFSINNDKRRRVIPTFSAVPYLKKLIETQHNYTGELTAIRVSWNHKIHFTEVGKE